MYSSRYRIRRRVLVAPFAAAVMVGLIAAGCGSKSTEPATTTTLRREPVNFAGADPFTPPVGADVQGVTRPANTGGTVQARTAGLFGGTQKVATCNPQAMVAFLQTHPDKANAWAGVLGVAPTDIPAFVNTLTSVVLRTDTVVTNHGFVNGKATDIPAVLQAGTAVLVDKSGTPVTKCFCGNPLTPPVSFQRVTFVGTSWTSFSATTVTVIQSTVNVINRFTLVEPVTGTPFDRPAGTNGPADGPATATPVLPPPGSPPASTVAPSQVAPPTGTPSTGPPTTGAPSTVVPSTVTASPAPTTARTSVPPTLSSPPVVPPPAATSASATSSRPATASSAVPTSPAPTTSAPPVITSWVVGGCFTDRATTPVTLRGTVLLRNNDPTNPHSYALIVQFGPQGAFGQATVTVPSVGPNRTARAEVSLPATATVPAGTLPCAIATIVTETGQKPLEGPALTPPPDVTPQPTTETSSIPPMVTATPTR